MKIVQERNFTVIERFLHCNFSSPTHWPDWNIIVSKYFNTEFFYFCAYQKDELIGICPVHKEKKGLLTYYKSGQFQYIPFGGWIFSKEIDISSFRLPISSLSQFQSFCLPLLTEFKNLGESAAYANFSTLVIDLSDDLDSIWTQQLNAKRRNMIRKAEKSGVEIDLNCDIENFYSIYKDANTRLGLNIHKKSLFYDLMNESRNIRFEIISAKLNGEYLANVVIVFDKNYSIYWLGNSLINARNLGQGELLQWTTIKRMKETGCRYYDLCYIEKERLPSIYKFKSGFSKNEVIIPLINKKSFLFRVLNKPFKV